jgi:hypothetical protein
MSLALTSWTPLLPASYISTLPCFSFCILVIPFQKLCFFFSSFKCLPEAQSSAFLIAGVTSSTLWLILPSPWLSSVGHLYLRISWAPDLHSQLLCMPHIQIWGADCWVREQFVFADCQQSLFISVFMITLGDKYEWHMVTGFEMLYSQSSRKVWLFFLFWILTHSKQKEL